jgi:hypothetical protein
MLWLALTLAVGPPVWLSSSDRAALAALRRAVASVESHECPRQDDLKRFERLAPRSHIPTWRRLQQRIPSTRSGSADLAFGLAYHGVDYDRNLQRLLLPYRRWHRDSGSEDDAKVVEDLPIDLAILYRKHHDPQSLGELLALQLDGGLAESQASILADLWSEHPAMLLRLAVDSAVRLNNIVGMLYYANEDLRGAAKEVRPFTHHPDPCVARAARRVLFLLRQGASAQ